MIDKQTYNEKERESPLTSLLVTEPLNDNNTLVDVLELFSTLCFEKEDGWGVLWRLERLPPSQTSSSPTFLLWLSLCYLCCRRPSYLSGELEYEVQWSGLGKEGESTCVTITTAHFSLRPNHQPHRYHLDGWRKRESSREFFPPFSILFPPYISQWFSISPEKNVMEEVFPALLLFLSLALTPFG